MNKNNFFKGLGRNIIILGIVSFFTDISSEMVFPLIPLYLVSIGAGAWIVGLVEGAAETTASFLKVFSGYLSDKIKKRKPFVIAGYSLSTLTKPLFAIAASWPFVLIIRIVERIGKGIRTAPRDAIIAESCDSCVMGKGYGFHRAMDNIGAFFGASIAFLLFPLVGFKNIFLYAFIPGIIAVICVLAIKEKKDMKECKKSKPLTIKVSLKSLPKNLKFLIFVLAVFTFGNFGYAFLLLKTKLYFSYETAILFYMIFLLISALFSISAGMLSDKIGRKPVIIIGYLIFGITCILLTFFSALFLILLGFILFGVFSAFVEGVQKAYVVDLAPADLKGTALGTYHTAIGIVALPAGLIMGLIWDTISSEAMFVYSLFLTSISIILFLLVKNNK